MADQISCPTLCEAFACCTLRGPTLNHCKIIVGLSKPSGHLHNKHKQSNSISQQPPTPAQDTMPTRLHMRHSRPTAQLKAQETQEPQAHNHPNPTFSTLIPSKAHGKRTRKPINPPSRSRPPSRRSRAPSSWSRRADGNSRG